jgi:hypothetical protein
MYDASDEDNVITKDQSSRHDAFVEAFNDAIEASNFEDITEIHLHVDSDDGGAVVVLTPNCFDEEDTFDLDFGEDEAEKLEEFVASLDIHLPEIENLGGEAGYFDVSIVDLDPTVEEPKAEIKDIPSVPKKLGNWVL